MRCVVELLDVLLGVFFWREMIPISYASFSSIWFWLLLVGIWAIFVQYFFGVSYHQLKHARHQSQSHKLLLAQSVFFYIQRSESLYKDMQKPLVLGPLSFVAAFWLTAAFYHDQELMQAVSFLVFPLVPSLIQRGHLAFRWIGAVPDEFEELFRSIRRLRRWSIVYSVLTVFSAAFWAMALWIEQYQL